MTLFTEARQSTPSRTTPKGLLYVDAGHIEAELKRAIRGEVRFDRGSRALYATDGSKLPPGSHRRRDPKSDRRRDCNGCGVSRARCTYTWREAAVRA